MAVRFSFRASAQIDRILQQAAKFIKTGSMYLGFYTLRAKKFRLSELFGVRFD